MASKVVREIIFFILGFSLFSILVALILPKVMIYLFLIILPWSLILGHRKLSSIEGEMMINK